MKMVYEQPEIKVYIFELKDIIAASGENFGDFYDLL